MNRLLEVFSAHSASAKPTGTKFDFEIEWPHFCLSEDLLKSVHISVEAILEKYRTSIDVLHCHF